MCMTLFNAQNLLFRMHNIISSIGMTSLYLIYTSLLIFGAHNFIISCGWHIFCINLKKKILGSLGNALNWILEDLVIYLLNNTA